VEGKWKLLKWVSQLFCLCRWRVLGCVYLAITSFYIFSCWGFFFFLQILVYFSNYLMVLDNIFTMKLLWILIAFQDQWLFWSATGKKFEKCHKISCLCLWELVHTTNVIVSGLVKSPNPCPRTV
jgi:hypothetical protein